MMAYCNLRLGDCPSRREAVPS